MHAWHRRSGRRLDSAIEHDVYTDAVLHVGVVTSTPTYNGVCQQEDIAVHKQVSCCNPAVAQSPQTFLLVLIFSYASFGRQASVGSRIW